MTDPSTEQKRIIDAPLAPLSVVACAGSGKTVTAVRRLAAMREKCENDRGRVALLSFSNVAVNTFRNSYDKLVQEAPARYRRHGVEITTLDAFITGNVLHPHAYRTMGAQHSAYLVSGSEPFLAGFTFPTKSHPRRIADLEVGVRNADLYFCCRAMNDQTEELEATAAEGLVKRLGKTGAYTHNLGRYWCYRTLREQPGILRALARRYPHILIDEAQDLGTLHEAIIEQLISQGCQVSLIGDPHQAIYGFAGANGTFLTRHDKRDGTGCFGLTRNYRSVPAIVGLANKLSGRTDVAHRDDPETVHGTYYVAYKNADRAKLVTTFQAAVLAAELKVESSAVLCRGNELADNLGGRREAPGQGIVKRLAAAALLRDRDQDYAGAFKAVSESIVGLLDKPPRHLVTMLTQCARYPEIRPFHRLLWAFARNKGTGLPSATLAASTIWHAQLLKNIKTLLPAIEKAHGLKSVDNLGQRLAKKELTDVPLFEGTPAAEEALAIRVDTVHKAKGESLDAVLYLATKEHVVALFEGIGSELGRIGYVAVTRARNLLWLGVPSNSLAELKPKLDEHGFRDASVLVATSN